MIHFQETITPTKILNGAYTFELRGDKGIYTMTTYPKKGVYDFIYPGGMESEHGWIKDLFIISDKLRALEFGLVQWAYQVAYYSLDSDSRRDLSYFNTHIELDGRRYNFEFHPENNDLLLVIPGYAAVLRRSKIMDTLPEIVLQDYGILMSFIEGLVIDAHGDHVLPKDYDTEAEPPLIFHRPEQFDIGYNHYAIQYHKETDSVYINQESRTVKTYLDALELMVPEIIELHEGKLYEKIQEHVKMVRERAESEGVI